ncbi:hypothetical protein CDFC105_73437 [Clostridioides difficile]|uniref:helix-turn-helix domain-containing protein n=1 Tax=Clostridioides sp. ZZV14-6150 TaxID=2811493 RepID=UPI0007BB5F77|nr:helix-turn-helix domain-containing protein [Clostridioides sp. ZZV14-6150]CZR97685.1 hypothetical protein CDFC105_62478 [Clostridioides difficile]CZS10284.1 hypothetical protein CDFC105_73437 [Clostridioides difficile]
MSVSENITKQFSDSLKSLIEVELSKHNLENEKVKAKEKNLQVLEPKDVVVLIKRGYPNYLISIDEARKVLKMDSKLTRQLVKKGLIKTLSWGNGRKISRYELDDFIDRNQGRNLDELLKEAEEEII